MKKILYVMFVVLWIGMMFLSRILLTDKCATGLMLNMVGVVITFLFAFPQKDYDIGCVRGFESDTVIDEATGETDTERREQNKNLKRRHKLWALLGLVYLLSGLGFQLWYQLTLSAR